jgi:hypothetical protein
MTDRGTVAHGEVDGLKSNAMRLFLTVLHYGANDTMGKLTCAYQRNSSSKPIVSTRLSLRLAFIRELISHKHLSTPCFAPDANHRGDRPPTRTCACRRGPENPEMRTDKLRLGLILGIDWTIARVSTEYPINVMTTAVPVRPIGEAAQEAKAPQS